MTRLTCGDLDPLSATNYRQLACVGILGLFFMGTAIVVAKDPIQLALNGQTVAGTVTEHKEEDSFKNDEPIILVSSAIEYPDASGAKHKLWIRGEREIGSSSNVTYLPTNPDVSSLAGDNSAFGGPALPLVMGSLLVMWTTWRLRKLLKRRKPLKALISRVSPISAEVIHVLTESYATTSKNNYSRTHRKYRLVARAKVSGNQAQEFESFKYQGWSPVETHTPVKLFVDPVDPTLYYLSTEIAEN